MRSILLLSTVLIAAGTLNAADTATTATPAAQETKKSEPPQKVVFTLVKLNDWKASTEDVKKLLYTTADELLCFYPERKFPVIEVGPRGGPITYFDRGPKGEIRVRLDVEGSYWNQLVYQFAHEMGHIVCDYKPHEHRHKWFEESVCETASIYVLRKVAEKWKTAAAIKGSDGYAKNFLSYAQRRLDGGKLPEGKTFADWFKENTETLQSKNADARAQQNIIATNVMLKHFERDPKGMWAAMEYLNTEKLTKFHTFEAYLTAWYRNCPHAVKPNVKQLAAEFQVEIKE